MEELYQTRNASYSLASADRAHQALNFLKNELPHWEDMLKYLDDDNNYSNTLYRSSL